MTQRTKAVTRSEKIGGVGEDAVRRATGRGWSDWLPFLDRNGGRDSSHKQLVAMVREAGVSSGWWQQLIANGYEQARGVRDEGQTQDAGYQIGVQRTLPVSRQQLWTWLLGPTGRRVWLGETAELRPSRGFRYETADGTCGEVRSSRAGERLRLTWQPRRWKAPSTLQLSLMCPRNTAEKTTLRFHQEKLRDAKQRESMRAHWRRVLATIEDAL